MTTDAEAKPDTFRIERSIRIEAPPEAVFPLIQDFHRWTVWSPWEKLDPAMVRTYEGAERGVGAVYAWEGKKAGAGRMEILRADAPSRVVIQLDFIKPFQAHNTAEFTLTEQSGATTVTWAMYGPKTMMSKVMGLFFNMDKLVGKDFEAGLAVIKRAAET